MNELEAFDQMTEEAEAEKEVCKHVWTYGSQVKVKMCEKCCYVAGLVNKQKEVQMIERKWMVLRLDTDGVTIVESHDVCTDAVVRKLSLDSTYGDGSHTIKFGYPWEA